MLKTFKSLAKEDGSHGSLLGDRSLPAEETLTLSMAGDPYPTSGGDIDVVNGR